MLRTQCEANRQTTGQNGLPIESVTLELVIPSAVEEKGRPFAITYECPGVTMDGLLTHIDKTLSFTYAEEKLTVTNFGSIQERLESIDLGSLTTNRRHKLSLLLLLVPNLSSGEPDTKYLFTTVQPYLKHTLANAIKNTDDFHESIESAKCSLVLPSKQGRSKKKIHFVISLDLTSLAEIDIDASPNLNADADGHDETKPPSFLSQLEIGSYVSHNYEKEVSGAFLLFWECLKVQEIHKTSDQVTSIVVKRRPGNPIYWYPDSITDATDHFDHPDATTETISDLDSLKPMPSFN